jgi:hypothetical protein
MLKFVCDIDGCQCGQLYRQIGRLIASLVLLVAVATHSCILLAIMARTACLDRPLYSCCSHALSLVGCVLHDCDTLCLLHTASPGSLCGRTAHTRCWH